MKKVLVTGGAGFIGSNASNILRKAGYETIAFDSLALGSKANLDPEVTFIQGDMCSRADLEKVGDVDYIIHLASSSSSPMFTEDLAGAMRNNVIGHVEVLEFAKRHNVKKVLFASTSSIYGNNPIPLTEDQAVHPPNFYAVSKHSQEEISSVYSVTQGLEIIGFRFMSVYGLHEEHKGRFANLVSQFIWGMEAGKNPLIYGDGAQSRDFVSARDVVAAFKLAIESEKKFGFTVFNIGTARSVNMIELVKIINTAMGTSLEPTFIENPIRSGYILSQMADLTKIHAELGYKESITLEDGIQEIVTERKKNPIPPASLSF